MQNHQKKNHQKKNHQKKNHQKKNPLQKRVLLKIKDRIVKLNRKVPRPQRQNREQMTALHKKIVHLTLM